MYGDFARIYDKLMLDYDYGKWSDFVKATLSKYGATTGKGLDLACGSGQFAIRLAAAGYDISGVDISGDMLNIARDNARAQGLNINFINRDIRELEVAHKFDFALIMCDGVNYLTDGLNKALKRINNSLKPNGILIFDISTDYRLSEIIGNNIFHYDDGNITYIWHNDIDTRNKLVYMDLTFFEKTHSGLYNKFSEEHVMRIYSEKEILAALEKTGFECMEIRDDVVVQKIETENKDTAVLQQKEKIINKENCPLERIHFVSRKVKDI